MATPYLTPDAIPPTDRVCYRIRIPNTMEFIGAVKTALLTLTRDFNWEPYGAATPAQCARAAVDMYDEFYQDKGWCMIGAIYPYASANPPANTLLCDGATYNRVDYPELYAALDTVFHIDADSFHVPMLQGYVPIGAGAEVPGYGTLAVGDSGGTYEETLSISQIPAHSHSSSPHAHSEVAAVPTIINGGLEAPAAAATAAAATTGATAVSIASTGGDEAHNNIQPFLALNYCIVAK